MQAVSLSLATQKTTLQWGLRSEILEAEIETWLTHMPVIDSIAQQQEILNAFGSLLFCLHKAYQLSFL